MLYDKDLPNANHYEIVVPPSINNHLRYLQIAY